MPLPLLPVIIGITGLTSAFVSKGTYDYAKARKLKKHVDAEFADAIELLEVQQQHVQKLLCTYGQEKLEVSSTTIARFVHWMNDHEKLLASFEDAHEDTISVALDELPQVSAEVDTTNNWIAGAVIGTGASAVTPTIMTAAITNLATASTGTAISSLSGAAASNAVLAWLGGGSLAAGGGGMAAGAAMWPIVISGPGVIVAGATIAFVGNKHKKNSTEYKTQVETALHNIEAAQVLLEALRWRIDELSSILTELDAKTIKALDSLESLDFDPTLHTQEFVTVLSLVRSLREIINTPVLDEETAEISQVSLQIIRKYRNEQ